MGQCLSNYSRKTKINKSILSINDDLHDLVLPLVYKMLEQSQHTSLLLFMLRIKFLPATPEELCLCYKMLELSALCLCHSAK